MSPAPPPKGHVVRRGLRVIRRQVAISPRYFTVAVLAASLYASATIAQSYVLGRIVDRVIIPRFESGDTAWGTAIAGFVALVAVGFTKAAGITTRRSFANRARASVEAVLRHDIADHYLRVPLAFHRSHPTGQLLAHAGADVEAAVDILNPLPYATGVAVMVVITSTWLLATDVFLAGVAFLIFPTLILLTNRFNRLAERPNQLAQERVGRVSATAHESFDGAAVVKAMGAEERETARFDREAQSLREARVEAANLRATLDAILDALPALGMVLIVVVGAWRIDHGAVTPGQLVSFVNLFTLLTLPLRLISYVLSDLPRAVAGYDRIETVLASPLRKRPPHTHLLPDGPLGVTLEHVRFSYEPGVPPALDDISLAVKPGSTVALVGPTGSGKSTLLLLLARLVEPQSGAIRIGEVPLDQVEDGDLAVSVSTAFQEPFLFGRSIGGNIRLGMGVEESQVRHAADLAQADRFIERLPGGYETVVGERGATLSGGQRQRVALARALLRQPRLLLLDDATSSVDPSTEARILGGLQRSLGSSTTIMVASRASTILLADEVVFLERGRVAGVGKHEDLLVRLPSYAELVSAYEARSANPDSALAEEL